VLTRAAPRQTSRKDRLPLNRLVVDATKSIYRQIYSRCPLARRPAAHGQGGFGSLRKRVEGRTAEPPQNRPRYRPLHRGERQSGKGSALPWGKHWDRALVSGSLSVRFTLSLARAGSVGSLRLTC
jgi:hypothetical protein